MSPPPHVLTRMKLAAQARAGGVSWAAAAEKAGCSERTCHRWVEQYPEVWNRLYEEAEDGVLAEAGAVAVLLLRKQAMSTQDEKLRQGTCIFLADRRLQARDRRRKQDAAAPLGKWAPVIAQLEAMNEHERKEFLDDFVARRQRHADPAEPGRAGAAEPG